VSAPPEIFVHADGGLLARAAAARIVTRLADAQAAAARAQSGAREAHLVLTGGGIGTKVLAELAASPARDAVDWRGTDFWWGDERFVPAGHPEGYQEALRNIYEQFTLAVAMGKEGRRADAADFDFPGAEAGVRGVRFVEKCVESAAAGAVWVNF